MPTRPSRPCAKVGCRALNLPGSGYCAAHKVEADARRAEYDKTRPSAAKRLYDRDWRIARAEHLKQNPRCVDCGEIATEVDHEIPHRGDKRIFWDRTNWRSRCKTDHSRKTATRDSRFARRKH